MQSVVRKLGIIVGIVGRAGTSRLAAIAEGTLTAVHPLRLSASALGTKRAWFAAVILTAPRTLPAILA